MGKLNHAKITRQKMARVSVADYDFKKKIKISKKRRDQTNDFFLMLRNYDGGNDFLDSIIKQIKYKTVDGLTDKQFLAAKKVLRSYQKTCIKNNNTPTLLDQGIKS